MIKMMAATCRRPGMTHAEYLAYLQQVHGAITLENPVTLRRYTQNHVFDSAFGTGAEATHAMPVSRDSVTELYWDTAEEMAATFQHEHVRTRVGPDGANFSETATALSLVANEVEQHVANPGIGGGVKVLHYLRAAEGIALPDFFARWSQGHELALAASPLASAALRRCAHSRQLPQFNPMLAYFGGKDVPIFEGVASLWFDNAATIGAFRDYERAMLEINRDPATAFYRPEQSFFLYATEVTIYARHDRQR